VRPKIMTVCAILFGLLPIMWSPVTQAGADVMKRIATPMIGGVVTSAILELLIYPVIYVLWRRRELPDKTEEEVAPLVPPALTVARVNRQRVLKWIALAVAALLLLYVGAKVWQNFVPRFGPGAAARGEALATQSINDLNLRIFGDPRRGQSDLLFEFRDSAGNLVNVGTVRFDMTMSMPGMTMHDSGKIQGTGQPGRYRARISPGMAGDWTANLSYDGPHGHGETIVLLNVKANR
jgi:AcrB/AcrD/AcrF family/YtkA-like